MLLLLLVLMVTSIEDVRENEKRDAQPRASAEADAHTFPVFLAADFPLSTALSILIVPC